MQADAADTGATGYQADRDRGTNAAVNRMGTFPQTTRRWWRKEFKALRPRHLAEVRAETEAAMGEWVTQLQVSECVCSCASKCVSA